MDKMLTAMEKGEEVVSAVTEKIRTSKVFPDDKSFLYRVAWVESRFGEDPNTYRSGYFGGIWQVDKIGFEDTQNISSHPSLKTKHTEIKKAFGIDWPSVKYEDLTKALYSAIAARLLIGNKKDPIPDGISGQADYWKTLYNSNHSNAKGTSQHFIDRLSQLEKAKLKK